MANLKGKALKRAIECKDAHRLVNDNIPLIQDSTELITPEKAQQYLMKNKCNRPINWNKVGEFADLMTKGEWKFHAQGLILDCDGNILTGQKRLWAIVYSGVPQYFRVSRGSPKDSVNFIDRGAPQTSRDLASRKTERKHSPMEQSVARAILAAKGDVKPTHDAIAEAIVDYDKLLGLAIKQTRRVKKTKARYMVMAAIVLSREPEARANKLLAMIELLAGRLDKKLGPVDPEKCWNKGAAFQLAMEKAKEVVSEA